MIMSMANCKTAVSPMLTHWRYCSPALSHRCDIVRGQLGWPSKIHRDSNSSANQDPWKHFHTFWMFRPGFRMTSWILNSLAGCVWSAWEVLYKISVDPQPCVPEPWSSCFPLDLARVALNGNTSSVQRCEGNTLRQTDSPHKGPVFLWSLFIWCQLLNKGSSWFGMPRGPRHALVTMHWYWAFNTLELWQKYLSWQSMESAVS